MQEIEKAIIEYDEKTINAKIKYKLDREISPKDKFYILSVYKGDNCIAEVCTISDEKFDKLNHINEIKENVSYLKDIDIDIRVKMLFDKIEDYEDYKKKNEFL